MAQDSWRAMGGKGLLSPAPILLWNAPTVELQSRVEHGTTLRLGQVTQYPMVGTQVEIEPPCIDELDLGSYDLYVRFDNNERFYLGSAADAVDGKRLLVGPCVK